MLHGLPASPPSSPPSSLPSPMLPAISVASAPRRDRPCHGRRRCGAVVGGSTDRRQRTLVLTDGHRKSYSPPHTPSAIAPFIGSVRDWRRRRRRAVIHLVGNRSRHRSSPVRRLGSRGRARAHERARTHTPRNGADAARAQIDTHKDTRTQTDRQTDRPRHRHVSFLDFQ